MFVLVKYSPIQVFVALLLVSSLQQRLSLFMIYFSGVPCLPLVSCLVLWLLGLLLSLDNAPM